MVEITLQLTEEELIAMLIEEFNTVGKFDDEDSKLYEKYFTDSVINGSGSFFFGPTNLRDWILSTLDRLSTIGPNDDEYQEVKELWESKEYEGKGFAVVGNYRNNYLVEWY